MPALSPHRLNAQALAQLPKQQLLEYRLCDLRLDITESPLQPRIQQLYTELGRRQLRFKPHFWLSDDWFCPDGIPGIAIPFHQHNQHLS